MVRFLCVKMAASRRRAENNRVAVVKEDGVLCDPVWRQADVTVTRLVAVVTCDV